MQEVVLQSQNLEVSFWDKKRDLPYFILRDINLEIYNGQKVAIIGESGSGKTTLGNTILLLNDPKETTYFGNLVFYSSLKKNCEFCFKENYIISTIEEEYENGTGYDVQVLDEIFMRHLRGNHISMIFQDPFAVLNPVIPVGKQIEEVLKIHNRNLSKQEIYDKTLYLLSLVNLPEPKIIYNKYPHQLSGGQQQRICIAIAIANNPELIIADEPTTALDAHLKDTILQLLTELVSKNLSSLLLITHDINIVKNYVDYIYILYAGEILECGSTKQIFYNPLHPYTQMLLSCNIDKTKRGTKLPTIPYDFPDLADQDFIFERCIFLNRCQKKKKVCEEYKPTMYSVKEQKVKCFLYEQ